VAPAPEWAEGKLAQRATLTLRESLPWLQSARMTGVRQFIETYRALSDAQADELFWGDEIEYAVVRFDEAAKAVRISLRADELLAQLVEKESNYGRRDGFGEGASWHPEYGAWMIEGTPRLPYGGFTADLRRVEASMVLRRKRLASVMGPEEAVVTMPAFPMMGVGDFCHPMPSLADNECTASPVMPDAVILPAPRFHALTRNIRERRGGNVQIRVPLLRDTKTDEAEIAKGIHMDAMAYGMGCCCLQVTFQARDADESRHLYDHLAVLSPILLALTAATPVLHGRLADTDVRWATISASVDDRTPAERGETAAGPPDGLGPEEAAQLAGGGAVRLPKSRYDSISRYLANCQGCQERFNDVEAPVDSEALALLRNAGIDESLAQHVAHLFTRDPLTLQRGHEVQSVEESDHFDAIQSTNWQTVRWKPPPKRKNCGPRVGWRVEFRSMEVGLTDFENAAFTTFVVLVSRVILAFDLNLYMPLSLVDDNMARAHGRDAAHKAKFHFRRHMAPPDATETNPDGTEEMSIHEILCGKGDYFPGLIPLIQAYLDSVGCDAETGETMRGYLDLIKARASGQLQTPAQWMRGLVAAHPDYKRDSMVPQSVAADLVRACVDVAEGRRHAPALLGKHRIAPLRTDDAWYVPLRRDLSSTSRRAALLERYASRAAGTSVAAAGNS